ncbi:MAG: aldo/keto reductase [Thermodesulfobacteriota bacterium]
MVSRKIGRRDLMKLIPSFLFGLSFSDVLTGNLSFGQGEKKLPLEYRPLGKTGLKVTAISMGVMNCSDPSVLHRAYELGINLYDTADCYMNGRNEEMVGQVFQGKRNKVLIQTKVHPNVEKKMRASVERSLRRLRTDYIDVLLWHNLHSPEEVSNPRLNEFMTMMKKEGKIRFSGFSVHSHMVSLLTEAIKTGYHDVVLVAYNFTHSKNLKEAVSQGARSGIGMIAMKTQAGGYKKEKMGGLTPHQAALKYILMDSNLSAAIPGVTTIEQLEECVSVMGVPLTRRDLQSLKEYYTFLKGRICTMCGGCVGECPLGVNPQDFLRAWMYHDGYEDDSLIRESLGNGLTRTFQTCGQCSSCSIHCRQGLDIKAKLNQIQEISC